MVTRNMGVRKSPSQVAAMAEKSVTMALAKEKAEKKQLAHSAALIVVARAQEAAKLLNDEQGTEAIEQRAEATKQCVEAEQVAAKAAVKSDKAMQAYLVAAVDAAEEGAKVTEDEQQEDDDAQGDPNAEVEAKANNARYRQRKSNSFASASMLSVDAEDGSDGSSPSSSSTDSDEDDEEILRKYRERKKKSKAVKKRSMVEKVSYTMVPLAVPVFTGLAGTKELADWMFALERSLTQLQLNSFSSRERHALQHVTRDVYMWYAEEKHERMVSGAAYVIDSWEAFREAFARTYEVRHDADEAIAEYHSGGMAWQQADTIDSYWGRARLLRQRLPMDRASNTDFIEKILAVLRGKYPAMMMKVQKKHRKYREDNRNAPMSLHMLRGVVGDAWVESVHAGSSGSAGGHHTAGGTSQQVAELQAALAKAKAAVASAEGRLAGKGKSQPQHKVAAAAVTTYALAAATVGAQGGAPEGVKKNADGSYFYPWRMLQILRDKGMCYKCGKEDHRKSDCPSKAWVDLTKSCN